MDPARETELEAIAAAVRGAVASIPEVAVAYIFGSVVRGQATTESDLDVGIVYRDREGGARVHERVVDRLAFEIGRATRFERVDVVELEGQGPIFGHTVLLEGKRVYVADEARRIDFETETVSRAIDFRPTYEIATQGKIKALRRWLKERYAV